MKFVCSTITASTTATTKHLFNRALFNTNVTMWIILICLLTRCVAAIADCGSLEKFFQSIVEQNRFDYPVFVRTFDEHYQWSVECDEHEGAAHSFYESDSEAESLVQYLIKLRTLGAMDSVFFGESGNHSYLLHELYKRSSDFFNHNVIGILPEHAHLEKMTTQLNTELLFYQSTEEGYSLAEKYAIKSGPVVVNQIGVWKPTSGLNMTTQNKWERRSSLGGIVLIVSVLHHPGTQFTNC
jgi:hypothetical protein